MRSAVIKVAGIGLALAVWQGVTTAELVPAEYFPAAPTVFRRLLVLLTQPNFVSQLAMTCVRMLSGLMIAVVLGLLLALLAARFPVLRKALRPLVDILRVLPPPAIVPIAIFALGIGQPLFLFIVAFASLWPIYVNADNALSSAEPVQMLTSRSLGYTPREVLLRVRFPAATPDILTGVRIAAGSALLATIAAEMLAGQTGLGFMLYDAAFSLRVADMYAIMLVVGLLGVALNGIVQLANRSIVGWHIGLVALGNQT